MGRVKKNGFEAAAVAEEECVKNVVAGEPRAARTGQSDGKYFVLGESNRFPKLKHSN